MELTTFVYDQCGLVNPHWVATISGPWYNDSDPEGVGQTEQEAIDSAMEALRSMQRQIEEFLKAPNIVRTEEKA